jgi:hypothetical protein
MKESSEEQLKLIEINSRLGGGTIFSTLAGANIPSMILDMLSGTTVDPPRVSEITVVRYFEEIVIENGEWSRDIRNKEVQVTCCKKQRYQSLMYLLYHRANNL